MDGAEVAESLAGWLDSVTFVDRGADQVTEVLLNAVVEWGTGHGWRTYRRARSVMRLPPPYADRHSYVDVACARADGAPIVVEVDRSDRARTVEKLLAEAQAGRIAVWVRWGPGPFTAPPPPVHLVTCPVTSRRGLHTRLPDRPAPTHTDLQPKSADQPDLFAAPPPGGYVRGASISASPDQGAPDA